MVVLAAFVNVKLSVHLLTKSSLGKHSADCFLHDPDGFGSEHFTKCCVLRAAYVLGMSEVDLLIKLLACDLDLAGVKNDPLRMIT